jgi:long-chain fatty acid transport protein
MLMRSLLGIFFFALAALLSTGAQASGFFYSDLGAKQLGRGATGAAGAGDLSAIIYNPAGLAELEGLTVQLDLQLAKQNTSFTRSGGCGQAMAPCGNISDSSGWFANTISGVALNLGVISPGLHGLVIAAGVHGPSAVGAHNYPDPRSFDTAVEVATGAPQRYSLISSSNIILYPGISMGWHANDWLSVGAGAELRYFHITQSQSIFGVGGLGGDYPDFDAIATVDAKQTAYPVFNGGLIVRPIPSMRTFSIGLSGRLGAPVSADGTITIETPPAAKSLNISVVGNQAHVDLRLPSEARLGAQWRNENLLVELDGTWEGWGAVQDIRVTPENVTINSGMGSNKTVTPVAPIDLRKNYRGAFTGRLGGEYALANTLPGDLALSFRLGAIYETSAIPDETLQVDFVDGPRFAGTLGFTLSSHGVALTAGYAHYFQSTRDVSTSTTARVDPLGGPTFIIGNGHYETSLDALALELPWRGL